LGRRPAPSGYGTGIAACSAIMADLLDSMLVELAQITQTVADLEEQEEDIRLKLVKMRALQAELLGTADVLNRQRLDTSGERSSMMAARAAGGF
jgi:formiminotetrahydrofolate cyclodeaminase